MAKGIRGVIPDNYNTRAMLAKKIDRTITVVKRMEDDGEIVPYQHVYWYGELPVKLYHDRDVPAIRKIAKARATRGGWPKGKPRKSGALHRVDAKQLATAKGRKQLGLSRKKAG